ncbi:MAG: hypothetical protein LBP22_12480 [Deltaproteobacteria bacterium]|jgi:hypothetical protein|nr:hypothetical protein [Deltaproteobacteria bacterium]
MPSSPGGGGFFEGLAAMEFMNSIESTLRPVIYLGIRKIASILCLRIFVLDSGFLWFVADPVDTVSLVFWVLVFSPLSKARHFPLLVPSRAMATSCSPLDV